jgi:TRAP-type uncharacterized transport system fused permease subunit
VATTAFGAAGIADTDPLKVASQAVKLGIVAFIIPFMFIYDPVLLLLEGNWLRFILAGITAGVGGIALAGAFEGIMFGVQRTWERLLLAGAGLLTMVPGWRSDILGVLLIALVWLVSHTLARKKIPLTGEENQGL